jgi:hypothetical protein
VQGELITAMPPIDNIYLSLSKRGYYPLLLLESSDPPPPYIIYSPLKWPPLSKNHYAPSSDSVIVKFKFSYSYLEAVSPA